MAKITKTEEEVRQQNMAEAVSKTELFFKENGKTIYTVVCAVLVIALCILAYKNSHKAGKHNNLTYQLQTT